MIKDELKKDVEAHKDDPVGYVNARFRHHLPAGETSWQRYLHPDAFCTDGTYTERHKRFLVTRALRSILCYKPRETSMLRAALQTNVELEHWYNVVDAVVLNVVSLGIIDKDGNLVV